MDFPLLDVTFVLTSCVLSTILPRRLFPAPGHAPRKLSEHPPRMQVLSKHSESKDLSFHLSPLESAFTCCDGLTPLDSAFTHAYGGGCPLLRSPSPPDTRHSPLSSLFSHSCALLFRKPFVCILLRTRRGEGGVFSFSHCLVPCYQRPFPMRTRNAVHHSLTLFLCRSLTFKRANVSTFKRSLRDAAHRPGDLRYSGMLRCRHGFVLAAQRSASWHKNSHPS